jgi:serine/threonine-protein kinase
MSETLALSHGLPASIREGEVLGGKYRLEKEIGRGAMGRVWSAVHLTLGQRVAIKLISAEHAQSPDARARFSIEAKAAARLRSRYVVQVYDDGETAVGTPYIVLEYLDGETLEQRLDRERDVPLNDAVRITRHVARALSRAHAQGIVHRDLKPGNVFLARSEDDEFGWVAKVLDFGIAKLMEEHGVTSTTKTGTLLGTPLFMSPEQVRGASSVDSRSDLYSLGMVFYNMLTGTYACNGESFADVLVAICTAPLPDLRSAAPWVPASVAEWFQRACARELGARYQSADEMVEGLDLALGVSTGSFSRQSQPEVKTDTLRGHAPPVAHAVPRSAAADSGAYDKGSTQVLTTDPRLLNSNHVASTRTLDPELTVPTQSWRSSTIGAIAAIGAGVLVLVLGGAALLHGRGKAAGLPLASASSASSATAEVQAIVPSAAASLAQGSVPGAAAAVSTTAEPNANPNTKPEPAPPSVAGTEKIAARPLAAKAPTNPPKAPANPGHAPINTRALPASPSRNTATDIGF